MEMSDVIQLGISHYMAKMYTCLPASVETYDPLTKKVAIKPLIKMVFDTGESMTMPVIDSVPVQFAGTARSVFQYDLVRGDTGIALFSTKSLELWLGGSGGEVEPGAPRKYSLSDAIFIPGLFPFNASGKTGVGGGIEILHQNASIKVLDDNSICLNGNNKFLTTHTELNTALQAELTKINAELTKIQAAISGLGGAYASVPVTLDISTAQTTTIKTGG